jgi:hypothetical protein
VKILKSNILFIHSHIGAGVSAGRGSLAQSAPSGGNNVKEPERDYSAPAADPHLAI